MLRIAMRAGHSHVRTWPRNDERGNMTGINEKEIEHLAELARLELTKKEKNKLKDDLGKILDYFKELELVDTSGVEPLAGGTSLRNIYRSDEPERTPDTGKGRDQFPVSRGGFLEIPAVFE